MTIISNGKEYTLTEDELEQAYQERRHRYLLVEAAQQLMECVSTDFNNAEKFAATVGFTVDDACDKNSKYYLLKNIVEIYQSIVDTDIAENKTWQNAVLTALFQLPGVAKISYEMECKVYKSKEPNCIDKLYLGRWEYISTIRKEGYESIDALNADFVPYLQHIFGLLDKYCGDVRFEKTVYEEMRVGHLHRSVPIDSTCVLYGTVKNGVLTVNDAKEEG